MTYDLARCYAQAHRAVGIYVADKPAFEPWHEDLVQLVVMRAAHEADAGHRISRKAIWFFTVSAAARLFGDARYQGRRLLLEASGELDHDPASASSTTGPEIAIALWRLRDQWDELTELQQAALTCALLGERWADAAARLGTTGENLHHSLAQAIGRIDGRIKRGRARRQSTRHRGGSMSRTDKECRSCKTFIVWTRTASGKAMPCDVAPTPDGDFYLFRTPDAIEAVHVKSQDPRAAKAAARGQTRHHSHFATCPAAANFRKAKS